MKGFTILLLVLAQAVLVPHSWAQSARQLTRRITGEGKPIPPPPSSRPTAPAPPAPSTVPTPPRPLDPAKEAAVKAEKDKKTVEFLEKRAEQGSPSAQYDLGLRYLYGNGVEQNYAKGKKLLEDSAKNGNKQAAAKLQELKHWEAQAAKQQK